MNNLETLFSQFKKDSIQFCVRGRYEHLPKTLDGGDVDLLIDKKDWGKAKKIIKKMGFKFFPDTEPNLFFYLFDSDLKLIQLDILLTSRFPPIKKHKSFFIPSSGKTIPNRKRFSKKLRTSLVRRINWLFRGPVIVFEGPDGSGKTTNSLSLLKALDRFPLKAEFVHFATPFNKDGSKPSKLKRLRTRLFSILTVWKNKVLGRISVTDRYIFLTFRHSPLLKKIVRKLAPRPDILFITLSPTKEIRKRKKGQRDLLSAEQIMELYQLYKKAPAKSKVEINTQNSINKNLEVTLNSFLKKTL
tara:strand:+ start:2384 stop:3286 length:903 start_codon:yes stop_codon:yes gene_type:complete